MFGGVGWAGMDVQQMVESEPKQRPWCTVPLVHIDLSMHLPVMPPAIHCTSGNRKTGAGVGAVEGTDTGALVGLEMGALVGLEMGALEGTKVGRTRARDGTGVGAGFGLGGMQQVMAADPGHRPFKVWPEHVEVSLHVPDWPPEEQAPPTASGSLAGT